MADRRTRGPRSELTHTAQIAPSLLGLGTLLEDIGALKRVRHAGSAYSVGGALFLRAWRRMIALDDPALVARETTSLALVASQLGAIDGATLCRAQIDARSRRSILLAAFDRAARALPVDLQTALRATVPDDIDLSAPADVPEFVLALARQPRAGATAPDRPRLVLEPTESHAEHCFAVATYAVLVAPRYETDGVAAFLLALAHHLHNAALPDSGFAGEVLLGPHLGPIVERFSEEALGHVPAQLASRIRGLRHELLPAADRAEARAFHAADVIDRVLQVRQYARVAGFELSHALDDLGLVHAGPVQQFHAGVLAEAGL